MELPQIGEQCSVKECALLDFLPVKCAHCSQNFCKDHSFASNHQCTAVPDVICDESSGHSNEKRYHTCSHDDCSERDVIELLCSKCEKHFCVSHRHHGCSDPKKEAQRARREKFEAPKRQFNAAKEAVNKIVDAKIEKNRGLSGAKLETANKIQLMRLKQRATGRRNVPVSSRSYFLAHWKPSESTDLQSKAVFVNKEWPVGRVVDEIADQCKIISDPNPSAPKLRLFHMNGDILSENMSETLQKLLEDKIVIDGASLTIGFHEKATGEELPE